MSDQAVKIFEALSDVDQELLERCNRKEGRKADTVRRLYWRYGKAMAACICLMAAGAAAWSGYRLATGSFGSGSSGQGGACAELSDMVQDITVQDGGEAAGENTAGKEEDTDGGIPESSAVAAGDGWQFSDAAGGMAPAGSPAEGEAIREYGADGFQTESCLESTVSATASQEYAKQSVESLTSADKTDQLASSGSGIARKEGIERLRELENALLDSKEEIPWEEACALKPYDGYLPAVLPAGYEPFSARRSTGPDLPDNVIFKWSDGEKIFYMDMKQGEAMTKEELERMDGLNQFLAEDFRKEMIPELLQPAGEPVSFTLYYADGMRIQFQGYLTAGDMWDVVESVKK